MAWNHGLWWPWGLAPGFGNGANITLDATGEYVAFIGRISIAGQATSKTIDTTGSSSISFAVEGGPVFDNASSVFTVGFQGVDNTTGFPVRPDGTWTARSVITTAAPCTPSLTTSADYHVAIPTAGTATFSHGDLIAVVLEMTTRAGSDSVAAKTAGSPVWPVSLTNMISPATVSNVTGTPAAVSNALTGEVLITFSDGTIGTLDGVCFVPTGSSTPALTWTDASNPDEYGNIFQVPFACSIDAVGFQMRVVDATSDMAVDLYSDPTGTPTSIISGPIAYTGETLSVPNIESLIFVPIPPVSLSANTDYCLAVKATGAGNIRWTRMILPTAGTRTLMSAAGTTVSGVTRNAGSGAFGSASTTIIHPVGVRISDITASGGVAANPLRGFLS